MVQLKMNTKDACIDAGARCVWIPKPNLLTSIFI